MVIKYTVVILYPHGRALPDKCKLYTTFRAGNILARNVPEKPYSPVEHLSSALFRFDAKERVMAMLTMYIDESYSHPPKPLVYTVAGYISQDWRWKRFEREWFQALKLEGLEYFHMTEFAHKKKVYSDWPEKKRQKFLRKLHHIIHSNTIIDFAASVVVADFDEVITQDIREGFGEPHVFAAVACMKHIAIWARKTHLKDQILYVFERGTVHDKTVRQVFDLTIDAESSIHYRIGGYAFHDKKELLPLQAADTLAYENMLEMRRRIDPDNNRPTRASIRNLERPQSRWYYYDKAQLLSILSYGLKHDGLVLPPDHPLRTAIDYFDKTGKAPP